MSKRGVLYDLWRTRAVRLWFVGVISLLVLLFVLLVIVRPGQKETDIPPAIIKVANFTPYFYTGSIPGDFTLDQTKTSLTSDVLFLQLTNRKNQSVTITQQALPEDLKNSELQGGKKIENAPGYAVVSLAAGRISGTLLTEDKKTMVLLNTTDSVEPDIIMDLLRHLKPLR